VLESVFAQPLSKFSLVYFLVSIPPLHTLYISPPNNCLLFVTHAHTITICFAVVLISCRLFIVSLSLSQVFTIFYLNITHPSDHSHLCPLKCHLIFTAQCYACTVLAVIMCPSICLSVCPSHMRIVSQWLNVVSGSNTTQ